MSAIKPEQPSGAPSALLDLQVAAEASLPATEGSIDILTRSNAARWAWVPSAPASAVQIEAVLNGRVIGRTTADQLHPDLEAAGKGTGLYGFKISFDEPVSGDEVPQLRVLAAVNEGSRGVKDAPAMEAGRHGAPDAGNTDDPS
jgi:hypothetical protein